MFNSRLVVVVGLLLSLFGFNSCLEEAPATGPDNQIVVIGNGANGNEMGMTVVADVLSEKLIQSFIVQKESVSPLSEKLPTEDKPVRLDWVALSKDESHLYKFHASRENETGAAAELGAVALSSESSKNSESVCSYIELTKNGGSSCDISLNGLSISDSIQPHVFKDASVLYVDKEGDLFFSSDRQEKKLVAQKVASFFVDAHENIFFHTALKTWSMITKESFVGGELVLPVWNLEADIFYGDFSGNVYLYLIGGGKGASEKLETQMLYRYNASSGIFEAAWPKEIVEAKVPVAALLSPVSDFMSPGDQVFVKVQIKPQSRQSMRSESSRSDVRIMALSPQGVSFLPLEKDFVREASLNIGWKSVLLENAGDFILCRSQLEKPEDKDKQVTAFECKKVQKSDSLRFTQGILGDSDRLIFAAETLNEDPIYNIVAMEPSWDADFIQGEIKSFETAGPVQQLRSYRFRLETQKPQN